MAVRIRMKRLGRRNRPFYRICAMDARAPRDGRVIEELGTYDPLVKETDARCVLNGQRVTYWLSVGAQPSEKVAVLIKKYGPEGTHLQQAAEAQQRLKEPKRPQPSGPPLKGRPTRKPKTEAPASQAPAEAPAGQAPAGDQPAETPAESSAAE